MSCLDCNWTQLYIGIGAAAFFSFVSVLATKFITTKQTEKRFERNEYNAILGLIGFVNSFDHTFKMFYDIIEHYFGKIKEMNNDEWLPTGIDRVESDEQGMTTIMKSMSDPVWKIREKFHELNSEVLKNYEEQMKSESERIYQDLRDYEVYYDPYLRRIVKDYVLWTVFYVEWFRNNWNYKDQLHARLSRAKKIIKFMETDYTKSKILSKQRFSRFEKNQKIEDIPEIGKFVKKWQDYEESENNPK